MKDIKNAATGRWTASSTANLTPLRSEMYKSVLIFFLVRCVSCDNATDKYPATDETKYATRQNKLLTFNTDENGAIQVELDFNVPFLTIPVKPSLDMAHGAVANLNIGAVVLAGMMALSAAFVIPAVYHLISKKAGLEAAKPLGNKYRYEDDSVLWKVMASIDQALSEHNIDSTSCTQRVICWVVKGSSTNMSNGKATSSDKIIDGLATHPWINHLVDGSVFQAAIDTGLKGTNCSKEYSQCKITQKSIQLLGKQFMNAIYAK